MTKLSKSFQIVYSGREMYEPLNEKPVTGKTTYVGAGSIGVEFDSYEEALAYVNKNNLVYMPHSEIENESYEE